MTVNTIDGSFNGLSSAYRKLMKENETLVIERDQARSQLLRTAEKLKRKLEDCLSWEQQFDPMRAKADRRLDLLQEIYKSDDCPYPDDLLERWRKEVEED